MGSAIAIAHIWKDNKVITRLKVHANNIIPLKAELMAIRIDLISAFENSDAHQIIIITDTLEVRKKIISLDK